MNWSKPFTMNVFGSPANFTLFEETILWLIPYCFKSTIVSSLENWGTIKYSYFPSKNSLLFHLCISR